MGGMLHMIKPKIYLDSSVPSHLFADDKPDWQKDTKKLWKQLKLGQYEIIISPVVYEEFNHCKSQEVADMLYDALNELNYTFVQETSESIALANEYLATGVLKGKSKNDCRHIAVASLNNCKYILSWNMKHFVKRTAKEMVTEVNGRLGVFQPDIINPTVFIEGDDEDE